MNKFISLLVVAFVVISACSMAICETPYPVSSQRPDIFQFCELYVKRLVELENTLNTTIQPIGMKSVLINKELFESDGTLYANCSGGAINFNADDYTVEKWETLYFYLDDDKDKLTKNVLKAALALSVLEYDDVDETFMRFTDDRPLALIIYEKILYPISSGLDDIIAECKASNGPVKVYSGKYDYYLQYHNSGDGNEMLFISAT